MSSSAAAAAPPPNAQVPTGSRKTTSVDGELSSEGTREVEVPADDVEDGQVCDICGDVGYENLLAVCTQCGEGAEHVYCMQKTLEEKPEDWLCEACKKIRRENPAKQAEWRTVQPAARNLSRSVSLSSSRKAAVSGDVRSRLDKKLSGRRAVKGVPGNALPMKRSVEEAAMGPSAKRAALEGNMRTGASVEDLPISSSKKSSGDTSFSGAPVSKASDESGGPGKVSLGRNAELQLKRHLDDAIPSPAAKKQSLGVNASSGGFSGRSALQSGRGTESGKIRFISPPVPITPGPRGAKLSLPPESTSVASPRTNYKPPSQRGSHTAISSEADKITSSKGPGNLKATVDDVSFLLPSKTDLQRKGDSSANKNKDGLGKGFSQPPMTPRPPPSRGLTDVSSAIASAKQAKELAGRSLSSLSESKAKVDLPTRSSPVPDGLPSPFRKTSKTPVKLLPDLAAQKDQAPQLGLAGKGASSDTFDAKQEVGGSILKKPEEKSSNIEKLAGATGPLDSASAQCARNDEGLPCISLKGSDGKESAVTLHQSDRCDVGKHDVSPLPANLEADVCAGTQRASSEAVSVRKPVKEELNTAIVSQSAKVEPSYEVSSSLLKAIPTKEPDNKKIRPSPSTQSSQDGPAAVSCVSSKPLVTAKGSEVCTSVEPGSSSSCFLDQGAVVDLSVGNRPSKVGSPAHEVSQGLDSESEPKSGGTPPTRGKETSHANGEAEKKKDRLKLDLNALAPNTDSDSEEQQVASTVEPTTSQIEPTVFSVEGKTRSSLSESLPVTAAEGSIAAVSRHLEEKSSVCMRGVPSPGTETVGCLSKAVPESTKGLGDSSQQPRQQNQNANIMKTLQDSSASRNIIPALHHLGVLQSGAGGPPVSRPNERGGAAASISSAVINEDLTGKLVSQRPNQQLQLAETGMQGVKTPAAPRGVVWRGSFDIVMKEKASQYWGIMEAHISSKAVAKVYEVANLLPQTLRLEEARRGFDADSWPRQFQKSPPDDDSIALYFFASNTGSDDLYKYLLERMVTHDLVLKGTVVEGAELLVISSHLLPEQYQKLNDREFMWGVFRAKKPKSVPVGTIQPSAVIQGSEAPFARTLSLPRSTSSSAHPALDPVNMGVRRAIPPNVSPSAYPPLPTEPPPDPPPPPPAPPAPPV